MQARAGGIVAFILCIASLCASANAAGVRRPMVGFLPFEGPPGAHRYAIPQVTFWELSHIPGSGVLDPRALASCIQMDRLSVPKALNDAPGYSRLASATGVDYLVAGVVERQDASRVRFRMVIYSARDPRFRSEHAYECDLSSLVDEATRAAKDISSNVGAPASSRVRFDAKGISPGVLRLLDKSVRLISNCEADAADWKRSSRLADKAAALCPTSPMVSEWALSWSSYSSESLDRYLKLHKRDPDNLDIVSSIVWRYLDLDRRAQARSYARKWLTLDPTSLSAQIAVNGRATSAPGSCWRSDLAIATAYGAIGDLRRLEPRMDALQARCPKSAYVRYRTAYLSANASQWGSAACDCEDAVRLNGDSFRLQMRLINAYLDVWREDQALEVAKRALKRWPESSECHAVAAEAYKDAKQYSRAAAEMNTALKLDADASVDRKFLAGQNLHSGKLAEGLGALASADPDIKHAMVVLSIILATLFAIGVIGLAALVHRMLRPEGRPQR